jgi:hypothetical protein
VGCQKYVTSPCSNEVELPAALLTTFYHQHHNNTTTSLIMAPRGPELSPRIRARICELRSLGWSYSRIHSKHPELSISTIGSTCRKEASRANNATCARPGRPCVITEEQYDLLYDMAITASSISYKKLQGEVAPDASVQSVKRLLQEMNVRKWQRLQRPALTEDHAYARLNWAQRYRMFTYLNWRQFRWSDECSIQLGKGRKLEWVFIPGGKGQHQHRLHKDLVQPHPYGKQKSKMFWAAFGHGSRTVLVPMKGDPEARRGGVTARVYREILDQYLPPILGIGSIFMQDNAPIHTANIIKEWFASQGIDTMDWPPYSLDLNPIENLWALLKAEMYIMYPELVSAPNNIETLDLHIRCAIDTRDRLGEGLLNR